MENASEFSKEFAEKLGKTLFEKVDETEIYIIKCHLLIEYCLNHSIELLSEKRLELKKSGFTFIHKFKICILLGVFQGYYGLEIRQFIERLNKLRNQVAHKLEYDFNLLEEICTSGSIKAVDDENITKGENLLNSLKIKTTYFCGIITGAAESISKTSANSVLLKAGPTEQ